jgi:hypothetical protein
MYILSYPLDQQMQCKIFAKLYLVAHIGDLLQTLYFFLLTT